MICAVAKGIYTPSREEATILARNILGSDYVQAEFPTSKSIMEVWHCRRVGSLANSSFPPAGQCYKYPLVNITTDEGGSVLQHLDTRLMIVTENEAVGPCELHRSYVVEYGEKLWRVNQESGEATMVSEVIKLIHGINNSWSLPDVDTLEHHNWVLYNQQAAIAREDVKIRARGARGRIQSDSALRDEGQGSHTPQSRMHLPSWDEFVFGWVPTPPRPLTTVCVYAMAIQLGWLLFLNFVWPHLAVKLLRSLLPETYHHLLLTHNNDNNIQLQELRERNQQLREQQVRNEERLRQLERQVERLAARASTSRRPLMTGTHEEEGHGIVDEHESRIRRGTTERTTQNLAKNLRKKAFFSLGSDENDESNA
jgi:hypothetical protein